jgi:hypothetical protein
VRTYAQQVIRALLTSVLVALAVAVAAQAKPIPITAPVVPVISLSKPSTAAKIAKPAAYHLKAGKPVTWWFSVSDPTSSFIYGIYVFLGPTTGARPGPGSGTIAVHTWEHKTFARTYWTWPKPSRGTYRICEIARDMGPVRGGGSEICQALTVS